MTVRSLNILQQFSPPNISACKVAPATSLSARLNLTHALRHLTDLSRKCHGIKN